MSHPLHARASALTGEVIAAAIEVHNHFEPGLIESVYEWALVHELQLRGHACQSQQSVQIQYKGVARNFDLRYDILIDGCLLGEVKAIEGILPVHKAQLISYLKLLNIPLGLLLNFHQVKLSDGVTRLFLPGLRQDGQNVNE
jgi:GxxExxY protein